MGKRKTKTTTLTKIDPSILKLKPQAVSQHATDDGTRVITAVRPIRHPPVTPDSLLDPTIFDAGVSSFYDEHSEDCDVDDGVSGGYYVSRVCFPPFYLLPRD